MAYLTPQDRLQMQMRSMEECISKDNPVRFVDAFVEQLELPKLGFVVAGVKTEGRPAFNPKVFLKLYLYGYLNGLRSSRKLGERSRTQCRGTLAAGQPHAQLPQHCRFQEREPQGTQEHLQAICAVSQRSRPDNRRSGRH